MARTPNYNQDKRRKELDRKARKETKRLEREARRNQPDPEAAGESPASPPDDSSPSAIE